MTRRSLSHLLALPAALAMRARSQSVAADVSTTFDADGTAHIKRAIPVPKTISPESQALMVSGDRWVPQAGTKERDSFMEKMKATYPVDVEDGGFTSDSGSLIESIPMAALTGTKVISVQYRLAPQFPFPAAVEDSTAVYTTALKTHVSRKIAIYGTSAGAVLAAQTAVQIRKNSQPLPAVLGFFSGYVDLARYGDSRFLYGAGGLKDFSAMIEPLKGLGMVPYVGDHDRKDPVLSPIYADLKGFPPTLCMTSTRDHCLSGTADFHRALLRAGVDARLMVFDAMPHAFWYRYDPPESKEALEAQATFLDQHLG
jgi:dienelactone hydrolase